METRVKGKIFKRIIKAITLDWEGINNYQYAQNGRVWVLWDPRWYSVKLIKAGAQYVHYQLTDNLGKIDCLITVVYGHNTIEQRRALWSDIHNLAANITTPWLIGGDFNAVLYSQDRLMGNPITYAETQDFASCIQTLQLNELIWKGDYYTWSNKQDGLDRISSSIDRMFGNFEWMMQWGQVQNEYVLPQISDHSPMLLSISMNTRHDKIPFRFLNVWADHGSFLQVVQEV